MDHLDCCQETQTHPSRIETVKKLLPADEVLYDLAELFKIFGDSTRARIICALNIEEMCVCDLAALLSMSQSAISHQLRLLKVSRIVKSRKQGRVVYYALDDAHIGQIFAMAFDHVMEEMEG